MLQEIDLHNDTSIMIQIIEDIHDIQDCDPTTRNGCIYAVRPLCCPLQALLPLEEITSVRCTDSLSTTPKLSAIVLGSAQFGGHTAAAVRDTIVAFRLQFVTTDAFRVRFASVVCSESFHRLIAVYGS
jgi:hypothetical protein